MTPRICASGLLIGSPWFIGGGGGVSMSSPKMDSFNVIMCVFLRK